MLKKKRILLVTHDFTVTGAPLSLLNIAKILQKDYDISVWGLSGGALFSRYSKDLDIEPIILSNKYKKHPSLLLPKLNKFDFVILNTVVNKKLASICQNNGIPYMWTIREGQNLVCWHNKKLVKIIKKCQKNIYVVSEYAKEYIDKTYGVKTKIIHNLVPDEYSDFEKQKSDKLSFTFLGSIHSRKGVDLIVESFLQQNNTNWELNICGEGKLEHQLKEISKNCPNIKWQGVVTGDTRRKIFENTDIFLVPSIDEACSRVVLEAMMMACPVVISENVGAKYMVNDNTGWVVKTSDVESLKICIENILKNPEKIQTMKRYARQMYLSTSTEEIYKKNIYSIIEKNLKQPVTSKLKRMLFSKFYLFIDNLFDLSRLVFSVTNQTEGSKCRKVITFLGFKLKLRNKKKEAKLVQEAFNKRDLQMQKSIIEKFTRIECKLNSYETSLNKLLNESYKFQNILALENENLYAHIFNNLINNTEWVELKDFIPTGGAANYSLLFMILVTLNYAKPRKILELGIGQSSKLTCAYAKFNQENTKLQIIEHDQAWINTMFEQLKPSENINIIKKDMVKICYNNTENDIYEDLSDVINGMNYDFVLIDGPYGYNSVYPRMNILDLIPNNLASDFVIILDDAERQGERNTAQLIFNKLNDAGIKYSYKFRGALKTQLVITSKSREFINLY